MLGGAAFYLTLNLRAVETVCCDLDHPILRETRPIRSLLHWEFVTSLSIIEREHCGQFHVEMHIKW